MIARIGLSRIGVLPSTKGTEKLKVQCFLTVEGRTSRLPGSFYERASEYIEDNMMLGSREESIVQGHIQSYLNSSRRRLSWLW